MLFRSLPALLCAMVLSATASLSMAQTSGALPSVIAPPWQTIELGRGAHRYPFPVYANLQIERAKLDHIRHIIVLIHGIDRDADRYYETGAGLLGMNPALLGDTLLVAPKFPAAIDRGFEKMPAWTRKRWPAGEESSKAARRPGPISSFDVLNDLVLRLGDRKRLPQVQDIVIAGHSAGGQMVQRYAVLNPIDERVRASGVALRYVVANPSSYLYFSADRPKDDGKGLGPYNRGQCPDFNNYRYGLDHMPAGVPATGLPDARGSEASRLAARYAARAVTYLLGGADNNPEHRLLDKTCAAEAQGATRLARGRAYLRYEAWLPAMKKAQAHQAYEVAGVGHNNRGMFGSACGARALLGPDALAAPNAAACMALR